MVSVVLVAVALAAFPGPSAVAGPGLVLEVHEGRRAADAARLLAPAMRELAAAGYTVGERAARIIEARVSRPAAPPGAAPAAGQLLALASDKLRRGRAGEAEDALVELVRRYPGTEPSRREHGADAVALYREVLRKTARAGKGRLEVRVSDPRAIVFVDDRFRGVGAVDDTVAAGSHRVYVQMGKQAGRVREVVVGAGAVTRLRVAWTLDQSLRTGRDWAGLVLAGADAAPVAAAAPSAIAVARAVGADEVVLLAVDGRDDGRDDGRVLHGAVIDATSGRVVRRARSPIAEGERDRPAALARQLTRAPIETSARAAGQPDRGGWQKWSLGAVSLVGLGAGATLMHLDGRCQREVPGRPCPVLWNTAPYGWAALAAGVAFGAGSAFYFWRDARPRRERSGGRVSVVPRSDGAAIVAGFEF